MNVRSHQNNRPRSQTWGNSQGSMVGSEEFEDMETPTSYGSFGRKTARREDSMLSGASINSQTTSEERVRRHLKFFFMNPCEKYRAKGRKPWKLVLQLFKIGLVTLQLVLFGFHQFSVINFQQQNLESFEHMFIENWDSSLDSNTYPKSPGYLAVYEIDDFYEHLNYTMIRYVTIEDIAIGHYHHIGNSSSEYLPNMEVCVTEYKALRLEGKNYTFDQDEKKSCANFTVRRNISMSDLNETIYDFLPANNLTITWRKFISLTVKFTMKAFHIANPPDVYLFDFVISYVNTHHTGKVTISLDGTARLDGDSEGSYVAKKDENLKWIGLIVFDVVIIIVCLFSIILCSRSLIKARMLKNVTVKFFRNCYNTELSSHDKWKFVNFWYVTIVVSDILVIIGSILKIQLENKIADNYDVCSIMLGTGSLLVWFGVLHYLGFFPKYNILIVTMKIAAPNVLRFSVCVIVLFLAYAFCGWIVLGPYHPKFQDLNTASECMFSLVNGDDMFATFAEMSQKSYTVWIYSRVYLYTFISLFIYVVLSLFISVIMDTYETVKEYQRHGRQGCKSDLDRFISECCDAPESGNYRTNDDKWWFCCCPRSAPYGEFEPLID
ncbi:mucolipin-3-like isoform X2 [Ptychodera flava]|uniref:mucolipin-3-like isoform X2 n=1 Tax=Ptychodera flava TaxID=63121 RepID=UPI00396A299D